MSDIVNTTRFRDITLSVFAALIAIWIGYQIGQDSAKWNIIGVCGVSLLLILTILNHKNRLVLLGAACASLALGWRGITVFSGAEVYPAEVIILLASCLFFAHRIINHQMLIL